MPSFDPPTADGPLSELLRRALAASGTAMAIADATDAEAPLVYVNPAFERLTGYRAEQALGRNCRFLQGSATDPRAVGYLGARLRAGQEVRVRLLNYRPDGVAWWNELHVTPVPDPAGRITHFIGVQDDVTAQVERERRQPPGTVDALTGLADRRGFERALGAAIADAERNGRQLAVLFLDIDDFKVVNDRCGHAAGDGTLVAVANRLAALVRSRDVVARYGGDELLMLLGDLPSDADAGVARVCRSIEVAMAEPLPAGGGTVQLGASVGIAVYPRDGRTGADLLAHADADMYRAKAAGRVRGYLLS